MKEQFTKESLKAMTVKEMAKLDLYSKVENPGKLNKTKLIEAILKVQKAEQKAIEAESEIKKEDKSNDVSETVEETKDEAEETVEEKQAEESEKPVFHRPKRRFNKMTHM